MYLALSRACAKAIFEIEMRVNNREVNFKIEITNMIPIHVQLLVCLCICLYVSVCVCMLYVCAHLHACALQLQSPLSQMFAGESAVHVRVHRPAHPSAPDATLDVPALYE